MNTLSKSIYFKSPYWVQNLLTSSYGYLLKKKRYGKIYREELERLKAKDYTHIGSEIKIQSDKLQAFIAYTVNHSPFYKSLYKHIDLSNIKTADDLKYLPVVSKEHLRSNIDDVYTLKESEGIVSFTGGTTGKSLKVLFTSEDMQKRMAYLDYFKFKAGVEDPMLATKATFSGREVVHANAKKRFWIYNKAYRQRLYSTFHLKEEYLPFYLEDLNKFKPDILNGFVSAIYDIALFIERTSYPLKFVPKVIFTTSEMLLPVHREVIERVFRCKIYDQYASAEGAPFITECTHGKLHYNIDTGVIRQGPVDDNGAGNMIITSFTTHGTPLINYDIGDRVIFKTGHCNCGLCHPIVAAIEGRQVDFLYATDKTKVSLSHLADVIKGTPNSIKKMQFIQRNLQTLEVHAVIDTKAFEEKHRLALEKSILYRFGKNIKIDFVVVDDIERESSGKYRLIKNLIP